MAQSNFHAQTNPNRPALESVEPLALPHNLEAEQALLGALLIDNRLVEDVQIKLRPDHFHEPLHAELYEAILRLVDRNMIATPVTLFPLFRSHPALAQVGGAAYLAQLTANTPALIGARDFAQQIYDFAVLRELIRVGRGMVEQAIEPNLDMSPADLIQDAELALYKVAEQGEVQGSVKDFAEAARVAVDTIERAVQSGGNLSGVTTGLTSLNEKMGGLHRSDLIILAGRPGMGKTALATNIAFAAAHRCQIEVRDSLPENERVGAPVAIFSLEMSADQLASRILAEQTGVNSEKLRTGRVNVEQFQMLARAAGDLSRLPFYIDDTPALTIAALRTRARRLKRQKGVELIVVDYLQLLQGSSRSSNDSRVNEISEITRGLKTLAKELDVPVLALSQLSRAVESREDKRPQLSDLRESGTIEQDADIVLFVYREEYYHKLKEPSLEDGEKHAKWLERAERIHGHAEVMIAKQRHGATGTAYLHFNADVTRFTDRASDDYLPDRM